MVTPSEKNHNKHLDLLQDYKIHLIKYIEELEKIDNNQNLQRNGMRPS